MISSEDRKRKILCEFKGLWTGKCWIEKCCYKSECDKAITQLNSLYLKEIEGRMPKEKHTVPEQCSTQDIYRNSCKADYIWNTYRTEALKIIREMLGGGR